MDFFVHDNIETYNKRFVFDGFEKTRLFVDQLYIPTTGAFWYRTNYKVIEDNVSLHGKYLHLHAGLTQFHNMQFDEEPHAVQRTELFFNPDTKTVEIIIPKKWWKKETIFKKKAAYLGTKLPDRKITVLGDIILDIPHEKIHFILNYFPQHKGFKFHWEDEPEPTMDERISKTEIASKLVENKLNS